MARGFDADAAYKRTATEHPPFPFTWKDEEYELPNMGMLSTDEAVALATAMQAAFDAGGAAQAALQGDEEALAAAEDADPEAFLKLVDLLDELVPDEASARAITDMPGVVMAQLLIAWQDDSMEELGDLGKEPSPPSQPEKPAKRSRPTSQRKGKSSGGSRSTKRASSSAT